MFHECKVSDNFVHSNYNKNACSLNLYHVLNSHFHICIKNEYLLPCDYASLSFAKYLKGLIDLDNAEIRLVILVMNRATMPSSS